MIDMTLMTVHGFWSSPHTWDRLAAVWSADERLRGVRIDPFTYQSPKRPRLPFSPTRIPDYDDIAQTLANRYAVALADARAVAIVTHSQGGLIVQRFLSWMLQQGRGRELSRIVSVVMLACPNNGSDYARSLRRMFGYRRHPQAASLELLNKQVADTQRTVLQGIVNADRTSGHSCPIPFHVYAGASDRIVVAASAQAAFPGASTVAGTHFSILDPAAPGNNTADTVRHHILTDLASWHTATANAAGRPERDAHGVVDEPAPGAPVGGSHRPAPAGSATPHTVEGPVTLTGSVILTGTNVAGHDITLNHEHRASDGRQP